MKTVFLRVLEKVHDKEGALRLAIERPGATFGRQRFYVDPQSFTGVPGSPFAYWVSDQLRKLFKALPPFESEGRLARQGLVTADDFRFVRAEWEVPRRQVARWFPFAKGGKYSPFYADVYLRVNWERDGSEISNFCKPGSDRIASRPQNTDFFLRPGLTWPRRTKSELSFRVMPAGCAFGDKGPAAFVESNNNDGLLCLLAIGSSKAFRSLVEFQLAAAEPTGRGGAARSYEVGVIQRTPVPSLTDAAQSGLVRLARRAWSLQRSLDTYTETSHAFTLPLMLQVAGIDLATRSAAWSQLVRSVEAEIAAIQEEIDEYCFELYGIEEADRRAIIDGFGNSPSDDESKGGLETVEDDVSEASDEDTDTDTTDEATADTAALAAALISWAVGVALGRFDIRLATGERPLPAEPEPFDPLPACSPGMLTGEDGLPAAKPPAGYPIPIPADGVLVADPGHPSDLLARVRQVFACVFGDQADAMLAEAAILLDPGRHDLDAWLSRGLFEHHLKRHSKSRRKAPIYWQLGTASGSYSVWLYYHRLTPDTLFKIQRDYVEPKLQLEERRLAELHQGLDPNPTPRQRKEVAMQEERVAELRGFAAELGRVAPLWKPDANDGVILSAAPLWRLFAPHRAWQTECKKAWAALANGAYDWAHLAMHLWPERVIPKCATDRSLAIAHGLEDIFWAQDAKEKWQPRTPPLTPRSELIDKRTSPAVKDALQSLLAAPVAKTQKASSRRSRKAR